MDKIKVWVVKRKRKTGNSYAVQWQDPRTGKFRTEKSGTDKAYARQRASERRKELLTGVYREITSIGWADFIQEHLEHVKISLSAGSYKQHELTLRQFKEICEPVNLTTIDFSMLEKFRLVRSADKVSPATINKGFATLQSIFERAVKRGYLKTNPIKGNRRALWLRVPEKEPRVLSGDEYQNIYDTCPDDQWRGICTIAYSAGLRCGEILALTWDDVDMKHEVLNVINTEDHLTKSRKIRKVPMSAEVVQALQQLQIHRFKNRDKVFGPSIAHNVRRDFGALVIKAGLVRGDKPKYSLHDLRRSFGTNLANQGVSPKVLQRLLGHANIETTMKYYVNADLEEMRKAVNRKADIA